MPMTLTIDGRIFRHLPLDGVPEFSSKRRLGVAELNPTVAADREFPPDLPFLRRLDVLLHYFDFASEHPNFPRPEAGIKLAGLSLLEFRRLHRWFAKHETLSTAECIEALVDERQQRLAVEAAILAAQQGRGRKPVVTQTLS